MSEILANPVLVIAATAWLMAEALKVIVAAGTGQPVRWFQPGGMPSGHAATMAAATMAIGLSEGVNSPLFGLASVLAVIIFHDAVRVRWATGQTAERLNQVIKQTKSKVGPAVVWRGHRIREVAAGAALGIVLALVLYRALYA